MLGYLCKLYRSPNLQAVLEEKKKAAAPVYIHYSLPRSLYDFYMARCTYASLNGLLRPIGGLLERKAKDMEKLPVPSELIHKAIDDVNMKTIEAFHRQGLIKESITDLGRLTARQLHDAKILRALVAQENRMYTSLERISRYHFWHLQNTLHPSFIAHFGRYLIIASISSVFCATLYYYLIYYRYRAKTKDFYETFYGQYPEYWPVYDYCMSGPLSRFFPVPLTPLAKRCD